MAAGITVRRVVVPFREPFRTAAGTWTMRASWLLRLEDARGHAGWGEAVLEDDHDAPVLEGLLAMAAAGGLAPSPPLLDRAGAAGRAFRAALDGARLDLVGFGSGRRTGPDAHPEVGVNAVIGETDTAGAVEAAEAAVGAGFRTLKLKAGPRDTTASLVERVAAVRAAAGDAAALRLDVNGTWTLDEAVERLRALAGFALQYVEQPLDPRNLDDAAALRGRVGVPVAADEAVDSPGGARAVLDAGGASVLVLKPARVGGPVVAARIAHVAAERGVPVVVSSLFETGIGLAAALATAAALPDVDGWPAAERDHGLATGELLDDDLLVEPLRIVHGRMRAPGGRGTGGLGVRADEAAMERYASEGPA